jgi:mannose-6-phosphate isomerase
MMAGFRPRDEILKLLSLFECPAIAGCPALLPENAGRPDEDFYRELTSFLLDLVNNQKLALTAHIRQNAGTLKEKAPEWSREWDLLATFASIFPGDCGVIAPLYLNVLELVPGEAVFIPAGVLHSYIHGLGVELMANSDNVLRGGLTPKHVDAMELLRVLRFEAWRPDVQAEDMERPAGELFTYKSPVPEFELSVLRNDNVLGRCPVGREGPLIALVTEGSAIFKVDDSSAAEAQDGQEEFKEQQGSSVFIPAGLDRTKLSVQGLFSLYIAGTAAANSPGEQSH